MTAGKGGDSMGLALRKEKILSAVIDTYIRTGEPIGSKALLEETDLGVSSATVRNELKSLDEEGYLHQPHTSAGRVPTKQGYRYYIDRLMKPEILPERLRENIERAIRSGTQAPESILSRTATVLAAERVPKTDKLLKLTIDAGIDTRTIVSGIAEYYSPEDMLGKQICILANLAPRTIRGIESKGMILMAKQGDGKMRFITPQEVVTNGAQIG
jgi:methionine--tRNA ligase beta chain